MLALALHTHTHTQTHTHTHTQTHTNTHTYTPSCPDPDERRRGIVDNGGRHAGGASGVSGDAAPRQPMPLVRAMWFVKCTILKEFIDKDKNEVRAYLCG